VPVSDWKIRYIANNKFQSTQGREGDAGWFEYRHVRFVKMTMTRTVSGLLQVEKTFAMTGTGASKTREARHRTQNANTQTRGGAETKNQEPRHNYQRTKESGGAEAQNRKRRDARRMRREAARKGAKISLNPSFSKREAGEGDTTGAAAKIS
jgi:hypothetical protein